jgi:hypothetical protein
MHCYVGDLKNAEQMYRNLVQQFPGYIDCYLCLSAMAKVAHSAFAHLFLPADTSHASMMRAAAIFIQAT